MTLTRYSSPEIGFPLNNKYITGFGSPCISQFNFNFSPTNPSVSERCFVMIGGLPTVI